jgi:Fe-S-cluster containining protein
LVDILGRERSLRAVHRAATLQGQVLDLIVGEHRERMTDPAMACGPDCWACCDLPIITSFPLNLIAAFLQYLEAGHRPDTLRLGRPRGCVFFQDSCCTVYPARPSVCRLMHSISRTTCDSGIFDRHLYGPLVNARTAAVAEATAAAMARLGLEHRLLNLNIGLSLLHAEPDAVGRWLAGEPVFAAAAVAAL